MYANQNTNTPLITSMALLKTLAEHLGEHKTEDLTPFIRNIDPTQNIMSQIPVLQHLPQAIKAGEYGPGAALLQYMRPIMYQLPWNRFYLESPLTRPFLDNFGVIELVGSESLLDMPETVVGIFLLGPHTTYPAHHHRADEVYTVVSGSVRVSINGKYHHVQAGENQYIPSDIIHELQTDEDPMLALYTWIGAVREPVYFHLDGQDVQMPLL